MQRSFTQNVKEREKFRSFFIGNKYVYLKGDLTKNSPRVWEIRDPGKNPGRG